MPEKRNQPFEETRLEESFECNAQWKYMDIGPIPFNEFSTQCLSALPYGQGDLNSNESIFDTSSRGTTDLPQDYINIVNSVLRHSKCKSAYCLWVDKNITPVDFIINLIRVLTYIK